MPKFRKRPVLVDAIRMKGSFVVSTKEGEMVGKHGDWLITGVEGEQYPCDHGIFLRTYDHINNIGKDMMFGEWNEDGSRTISSHDDAPREEEGITIDRLRSSGRASASKTGFRNTKYDN